MHSEDMINPFSYAWMASRPRIVPGERHSVKRKYTSTKVVATKRQIHQLSIYNYTIYESDCLIQFIICRSCYFKMPVQTTCSGACSMQCESHNIYRMNDKHHLEVGKITARIAANVALVEYLLISRERVERLCLFVRT